MAPEIYSCRDYIYVCASQLVSHLLAVEILTLKKKSTIMKRVCLNEPVCYFPEPYTANSARLHLARVLELLRTSGPQDALREGRSPSLLETLTHSHTSGTHTHTQRHTLCIYTRGKHKAPKLHEIFFCADSSIANGKGLKRSLSNTKTESANQDGAPPDYLLPGSSERPLMALLPHSSQPEVRTVNTWNLFKHWASSPRHTQ